MAKETVEVDGQFFEIPNDVDPNKLELFKEYCKLKIEWEKMDRTFKVDDKVTLNFPRVRKKDLEYIKDQPEKVQREINKKRKEVQTHLVRMMHAKSRITKKSKKEVRDELEDMSSELIELFGRDYSVAEVHKILKDRNINIAYPVLLRFAKRNDDKIKELRSKWREEIDDVSISIKRSRLEKLNLLLNDLLQHYEDATPLNKLSYSKEIRGILEQARKEVEGEELKLTVTGRIDIEATISSYLNESQILRDLTIHQMVISRVATRLGIPSMAIIERLANSFYSSFNGFKPNNDLSTKILYPSATNYDILELEEKSKQFENKQFEPAVTEIKHKQTKERVTNARTKMNKKLEELLERTDKVKKETKK